MANLRLYLLTPSKGTLKGGDFYQGAVVAARNIFEARYIHPNGKEPWAPSSDWVKSPEQVEVELLGTALPRTQKGVILADFFGV